jgi:hypothetical protein
MGVTQMLKLSSLNTNNPYQVKDSIFSSQHNHERVDLALLYLFNAT